MIFPLIQATGSIDKIFDVPLEFFKNSQTASIYNNTLFPKWFIPVYNRCPGVKDKFEVLFKSFKRLSKNKQNELIALYRNSKDVKKICSDKSIIYSGLDKIDSKIQKPLKSLFEFLFDETIGTAVFKTNSKMHINDHYAKFQELNNVHVCPFCGLETYSLPLFRRAEYDHYLPISIYPWLGVNFNNLVPMGDHCNGKKNDNNILYEDYSSNLRRIVWYPYEWVDHSVKLKCKKKPTLSDMKGTWEVCFKADSPKNQDKIKTWDDVFQISLRYNEHIQTFQKGFIEDFAHKNKLKGQNLDDASLIDELKDYRDNGIGDVKIETMAQLKYIWADYYIQVKDNSELSVLKEYISTLKKRVKP